MRALTTSDPVIKSNGKLTTLGSLGGGGGEPPRELGGLEFRESDEGKPQYKLPDSDEWVDFNSGGGTSLIPIWENPDTSAPTIIDIDWSSNPKILIKSIYSASASDLISFQSFDSSAQNVELVSVGGNTRSATRYYTKTASGLSLAFGKVVQTNYVGSDDNNVCIPIAIYSWNGGN